jgi:soluble lytic murein transglycosylase-like protein
MSAGSKLILATALPGAGGGLAAAACLALALGEVARADAPDDDVSATVLLDGTSGTRRRPTLLASPAARRHEAAADRPGVLRTAARGSLCWTVADGEAGAGTALRALVELDGPYDLVAYLAPGDWRQALEDPHLDVDGVLVRADRAEHKSVCALLAQELRTRRLRHAIVTEGPGLVATRRALAGIAPGGDAGVRAKRAALRIQGRGVAARRRHPALGDLASETGQALPLVLGAAMVVIALALIAVAIGSATTGAGRVQRAADLAAVAAARSLRDDHPRLFEPARLPDGRRNPRALGERVYVERARLAAEAVSERAGIAERRIRVTFPEGSEAPVRVTVAVRGELAEAALPAARRRGSSERFPVEARATAEAVFPSPAPGGEAAHAEGDYSGPLAYRQGKPMRPDTARAFDELLASAAGDGVALTITSAYRSDAEQAALFAANPDPTWVAPPGVSLHRCGTELDLGPSTAYGWLAANAARFGFVQRYAWEAWHYGYDRPPAPCSAESNRAPYGDGIGERSASGGLPSFVPERFREPISRASSRWNVPAGLLAAQLMAESDFDPNAGSPAGAQGIAQFIPSTAAAYGLTDPFDPLASIEAQAHLMSDNLRRFGSTELALAAYNAGPAPVLACDCVPPYPETQAYVSRILGLMGGAGEVVPPALEVRLVA